MFNMAEESKLIVAVRIRGRVNVRGTINDTLDRLHLKRVSNCVIIKPSPSYNGMLKKCSNYIAYGEIDEPTMKKLFSKYLNIKDPKPEDMEITKIKEKLPFRLHPPRHGYKSTKLGFNQGGSLGYQGSEINKLIGRMI
ncbi:MAG: ribosomal protein L30 [Candidatus Micrarchaeum acidiphilum ARMAN-2]|jgi:50S ribosomal protein L30P, archaeal|uniref:Ribosomal protein L30 n=1 Tax=Candidatus Micrarchaeum acidiphilum ARMAN-2 TaxID=425595 RepID=C7DIP4_MICA2|nr:MAG: ribosomal protein L30 [Candidatus Micrarchaeum acidiphilum ARMAN-2]